MAAEGSKTAGKSSVTTVDSPLPALICRTITHFPSQTSARQATDDPLAVDIVAIYAGGIGIFDRRAATEGTAPSVPQVDAHQSRTRNAPSAPQPKPVTHWLTDHDMLLEHLPIARIFGCEIDLRATHDTTRSDVPHFSMADIATTLGTQLQGLRGRDPRPAVFLAHGYGCLVAQNLLTLDSNLRESTAAVGFLGLPLSIQPLIDWEVGHYNLSRDSPLFSSLLAPVPSDLWSGLTTHIEDWNTKSFAFVRKGDGGSKEKHDNLDSLGSVAEKTMPLADKVFESEIENIATFATMSGPSDQKFRAMTEYLKVAIHTHHLLSAAAKPTGGEKLIKHMSDRRIDVNLPGKEGKTALHVAVENDNLNVVKTLIETGKVDLDKVSRSGLTALHFAVTANKANLYSVVSMLLEAGALPQIKARQQLETPSELARRLSGSQVGDPEQRLTNALHLLDNPPPVAPPPLMKRLFKDPLSSIRSKVAQSACRKTVAAVREMFSDGTHIPCFINIQQLLYGSFNDDDKSSLHIHTAVPISGNSAKSSVQKPQSEGQEFSEGSVFNVDQYFARQAKEEPECRWYHIPMNNMVWVHDLFETLDIQAWPWAKGFRDFSTPFSRTVYPHAARLKSLEGPSDTVNVAAIMMPYISYESYPQQAAINNALRKLSGQKRKRAGRMTRHRRSNGRIKKWLLGLTGQSVLDWDRWHDSLFKEIGARETVRVDASGIRDVVEAYWDHKHVAEYQRPLPLHPRRTLDQSYYYMLSDTSFRDTNQVVSREYIRSMRREDANYSGPYSMEDQDYNILMVDQLWLWVVTREGKPDIVITSFPDRKGTEPSSFDDLQKLVLQERNVNTASLVAQILTVCCKTLNPTQEVESLKFLEFFENSVAQVEEASSLLFQEFRFLSTMLHVFSDYRQAKEGRKVLLEYFLNINKEAVPLAEVKDILDEIKMIQVILNDQLKLFNSEQNQGNRGICDIVGAAHFYLQAKSMVEETSRSFEALKDRGEAVEKSIEHLLDLKQKQANLWEARTAREGADETARQGNTLMVFTIATIIFLPLSFMASFFALNIASFPHDDQGETNWPLSYVCALLFGISFAISIPFILIAFGVKYLKRAWNRLRYLLMLLPLPLIHLRYIFPRLFDRGRHVPHRLAWNLAVLSAKEFDPKFVDDLEILMEDDDPYNIDDESLMSLFGKRLRRMGKLRKLGGELGESESDDEMQSSW